MDTPLLDVQDLSKHFGGFTALDQVSLHVGKGERFGLIGPNGSGKTTMINCISGALVNESGKVVFQGRDITGLKPHKICKMGVARTFQSVRVFPNMPVRENVLLGSLFGCSAGASAADAAREATDLIEFVGLSAASAIPAKDLTLGNQKRVEVARALATKPELMLLDEMMAGLNHTEVAEAMDLVAKIRDKGITVFMIEHVMKAIMSVCGRIMVLHHGEKIADGTPQEIAASKTVIEVYLGE